MRPVRWLMLSGLFLTAFACNDNQPATGPGNQAISPSTLILPQDSLVDIYPGVDMSPMDMIYFPVEYPKLKMANSAAPPPIMRVIYSRPHLGKRHLFHQLLKYNEPWRLGANEATEIEFYKEVTIQDIKIKPGRYVLYCVPHEDSWTIILNSNIDSWGLHQDDSKDIQRFTIPVSTDNPPQEYFTMVFEKTSTGADLIMVWDNILAKLPISF